MKRFAQLYQALDRSTGTLDKRAALVDYFGQAPAADAAWALWLLTGRKVGGAKQKIATTTELRRWVAGATGLPLWLVETAYHEVGDLAETLTLLMPDPQGDVSHEQGLAEWIEAVLLPLANAPEPEREAGIVQAWRGLPQAQRLVFNKLLTGSLRVGVSQALVQQALAQWRAVPVVQIAQRLLGNWQPEPGLIERLFSSESLAEDLSAPHPFSLASPLEQEAESLGPLTDWLIEWKWDGIRLQLIKRRGQVALWSRGEERLDGRFPELEALARLAPFDAVFDGELLAWQAGAEAPMAFTHLQKRIQRRKPSARMQAEVPVRFVAYDLLEIDGEDLRAQTLQQRRERLAQAIRQWAETVGDETRFAVALSEPVVVSDWQAAATLRAQSRERGVEGFMLKRLSSHYQHGRKRGDWWKWKVDPLTIDAVLIYAQAGHGRRATLHTDYTFGVWHGDQLVPVAKAYSGLTDAEIDRLDRWIRANTLERFGPVRSVRPHWVFELGFEGVNVSSRHKSGVALRFPRILRWREDKPHEEADQLETLKGLAR